MALTAIPTVKYEVWADIGEGASQFAQAYAGTDAETFALNSVNNPDSSIYYGGTVVRCELVDGAWEQTIFYPV